MPTEADCSKICEFSKQIYEEVAKLEHTRKSSLCCSKGSDVAASVAGCAGGITLCLPRLISMLGYLISLKEYNEGLKEGASTRAQVRSSAAFVLGTAAFIAAGELGTKLSHCVKGGIQTAMQRLHKAEQAGSDHSDNESGAEPDQSSAAKEELEIQPTERLEAQPASESVDQVVQLKKDSDGNSDEEGAEQAEHDADKLNNVDSGHTSDHESDAESDQGRCIEAIEPNSDMIRALTPELESGAEDPSVVQPAKEQPKETPEVQPATEPAVEPEQEWTFIEKSDLSTPPQ